MEITKYDDLDAYRAFQGAQKEPCEYMAAFIQFPGPGNMKVLVFQNYISWDPILEYINVAFDGHDCVLCRASQYTTENGIRIVKEPVHLYKMYGLADRAYWLESSTGKLPRRTESLFYPVLC